jgi:formylglycine-generating enzyme required for sulfatase activity
MTGLGANWIGLAVSLVSCAWTHAESLAFVQKLEGTDVSFKMVPIPAGSSTMGSPATEANRNADEGPQHPVTLEAFFMEEHEVTWGEFNLFLLNYNRLSMRRPVGIPTDKLADAVTFPTPMYDIDFGPQLQRMGGRSRNMPAVLMSQFAARQYTKWVSKKTGRFYRLPSEAEWEYAARAGTKTAYFFGDDPAPLGEYAWFKANSNEPDGKSGYHAVMTKKPNPWGLYDMYGNATEWCVDLYEADAYANCFNAVVSVNWAGKTNTPYPRVLRGGSYDSDPSQCRSASRLASSSRMNQDPAIPPSPHWMSEGRFIGFRVVSPVNEPAEAEKQKWWNADDAMTLKTLERDREHREVVKPGAIER